MPFTIYAHPIVVRNPIRQSTDTGIIDDWLWADLAKNIAGWAENDCGVSDTNIICDLFWTDIATDIATWAGMASSSMRVPMSTCSHHLGRQ